MIRRKRPPNNNELAEQVAMGRVSGAITVDGELAVCARLLGESIGMSARWVRANADWLPHVKTGESKTSGCYYLLGRCVRAYMGKKIRGTAYMEYRNGQLDALTGTDNTPPPGRRMLLVGGVWKEIPVTW